MDDIIEKKQLIRPPGSASGTVGARDVPPQHLTTTPNGGAGLDGRLTPFWSTYGPPRSRFPSSDSSSGKGMARPTYFVDLRDFLSNKLRRPLPFSLNPDLKVPLGETSPIA
ncbi:hypothetical protein niasHT_014434 [Heterodera trifolii]|uniref:Uncharacterized protein n=1 Tax=Heterodera trifolii TaxID=157864 RepID=A0ABD2KZG1_9BILA